MLSSDQHNLEVLLKSHFPIVVVETHEEKRAIELLKRISLQDGRRLLKWTAAEGLLDCDYQGNFNPSTESWAIDENEELNPDLSKTAAPIDMLEAIKKQTKGSIITLVDFHPYISDPRVLRALKEIAQERDNTRNCIILISHDFEVPSEISKLCTSLSLSLPDESAIRKMVLEEAKIWSMKHQQKVKTDRKALDLLIRNLAGLTISDAKRLVRNAIYTDGAISHSDVKEVMEAKYKLVDQSGVLSFEYDTASFSDVGGFKKLKKWLSIRKDHFLGNSSKSATDSPKGILLLGVQGCGKSLAAKAVAGVWGVPLIRLDFGTLYNKYIGETEKNIREALTSTEVLAPCVLWIDEIEKGIQTSGEDNGTSQRVLGTLLTWMSENERPVFIVATANDIESLPPELIRKGRMDEIFFVDLPNADTRKSILGIHLQNREIDPGGINLNKIVDASDGFSGAELEQVVVSAYYLADAANQKVATEHLLQEIRQTRPLSVVMAEKVNQLRHWAKGRTVSAD